MIQLSADIDLQVVECSCRPGTEGTHACNFGRACGYLTIDGRDVGDVLIAENLAHPYVCGRYSCPRRKPWCPFEAPGERSTRLRVAAWAMPSEASEVTRSDMASRVKCVHAHTTAMNSGTRLERHKE